MDRSLTDNEFATMLNYGCPFDVPLAEPLREDARVGSDIKLDLPNGRTVYAELVAISDDRKTFTIKGRT